MPDKCDKCGHVRDGQQIEFGFSFRRDVAGTSEAFRWQATEPIVTTAFVCDQCIAARLGGKRGTRKVIAWIAGPAMLVGWLPLFLDINVPLWLFMLFIAMGVLGFYTLDIALTVRSKSKTQPKEEILREFAFAIRKHELLEWFKPDSEKYFDEDGDEASAGPWKILENPAHLNK